MGPGGTGPGTHLPAASSASTGSTPPPPPSDSRAFRARIFSTLSKDLLSPFNVSGLSLERFRNWPRPSEKPAIFLVLGLSIDEVRQRGHTRSPRPEPGAGAKAPFGPLARFCHARAIGTGGPVGFSTRTSRNRRLNCPGDACRNRTPPAFPARSTPESTGPLPGLPHDRPLISGGEDTLHAHLRPWIDQAQTVDLTVSFLMVSGVRLILPHLQDLLARGGRLRLLTGDYLDVTQPGTLRHLIDLHGDRQLHVFQSARIPFHPKALMFGLPAAVLQGL